MAKRLWQSLEAAVVGWRNRMSLGVFLEGRRGSPGWQEAAPRDPPSYPIRTPLADIETGGALAQGIVDTIREPLVVLDDEMRVVTASRSFYRTFQLDPDDTRGRSLYELGGGEWNIARLRLLLGQIIPEQGAMEDFEVEHDFKANGRRTMLLNARKVFFKEGAGVNILLSIEDVTAARVLQRDKDELLLQKDTLLDEIQHRVANSLQIIASIISMKARKVASEEARRHLEDIHSRVVSVAAVQQHLHQSTASGFLELLPYVSKLCAALSASMIGDNTQISICVRGGGGNVAARQAESLGLLVTELVINSLKHAFNGATKDGQIVVSYDASGDDWILSVADNGIGKQAIPKPPRSGLGAGIVDALARQLEARVETTSDAQGTTVTVTHAVIAADR
jgi:two-component sensor histidine kinase/PAS domain-containing protein